MAICPTCMTKFPDSVATCEKDDTALVPDEAFAHVDRELAAGDMVGEYRIEKKLGEGGFGAVFGAIHPVIGKHAAIKVLSRQFSANPQMVSRFIAEARAVNQIRHRNIIDIFAFGQLPDGRQYYVMELLDGAPFDRYLSSNKRLTLAQALPILRGITRALDAAHAKGILHRDLKPENVFVVFDEDGGVQPKLLDFGLVKLLDTGGGGDHKTKTGTPMGTPYYMSPEQCRGKDVDRATDIYAFGALVFEVLTGRVPFTGDSPMDILLKHMTEEPPRASEVCAAVPAQLDEPIRRMLAKDAAARPVSVGEAFESLVAAGNAAGILVGVAPLPLPSKAPDAFHAMATVPSISGGQDTHPGHAPTPAAVITNSEHVSPNGSTFLASEADVAPARSSRARLGAIAAVALLGLLVGGAMMVTLAGSHRPTSASASASTSTATGVVMAPPAITPAAATTAPVTSAPSVVAESAEVDVRVDGAPKDAKVMLGSRELGAAPGPFKLKAGAPVTLTVTAPGFKPRELSVTPAAGATVQATLTKAGPAGKAPAGKTGQPISSDLEGFDKK